MFLNSLKIKKRIILCSVCYVVFAWFSIPSTYPSSPPREIVDKGRASGTAYPFVNTIWLQLNFRYLILNKKVVIRLMHILRMSDFFDWR